MTFDGLYLSPYYLNSRRLALLGGFVAPPAVQVSLAHNSENRVAGMNGLARYSEQLLRSGEIPNLTRDAATSVPDGDRVIGFLWGVFTFRGVPAAIAGEYKGKPYKNATFSGVVPIGDREFSVSGELMNDHFYSVSSQGMLSGKKRMLVAGQFQFDGDKIEAFPFIIGEMVRQTGYLPISWSSSIRVHPSMIDAFRLGNASRPTKSDLARVQSMSENAVKHAFAQILGEPFVAKDWGGERSDLYTSRISVSGKPTAAAFILKGPSVAGTMHPANMGKRGDQLIRAFDEPADLIVIQHCNEIATSVVKMAESLAYDPRRPRQYCIIDGSDTAAILKANNLLQGQVAPE
jgi:hypothetical protein